jgi:hypothetical protein
LSKLDGNCPISDGSPFRDTTCQPLYHWQQTIGKGAPHRLRPWFSIEFCGVRPLYTGYEQD